MPNTPHQQPPSPDQYWLKTGELPSGPFTITQIHAEIKAGRATWQTLTCPVGEGVWLPLSKTAGIGPGLVEAVSNSKSEPTSPVGNSAIMQTPNSTPHSLVQNSMVVQTGKASDNPPPSTYFGFWNEARIGAAIRLSILIIAGLVIYGIYEWVRPLSATEVCRRFADANTAAEAKKHVTPRMYPLIDTHYMNQTVSDPNDTHEFTKEIDGPLPHTKLVGFRFTIFVQEEGRRVRMEGHMKMVKSDGWKADDMVVTAIEGLSLPGPYSVVEDTLLGTPEPTSRETDPSPSSTKPVKPEQTSRSSTPSKMPDKPDQTSGGTGTSTSSTKPVKTPDRPAAPKPEKELVRIFYWVKDMIGWTGIIILLVLFGVVAVINSEQREKSKK